MGFLSRKDKDIKRPPGGAVPQGFINEVLARKTLTAIPVDEFTFRLSSKDPVPGGGGAAALTGALGAALGGMVANLTAGKQKYSGEEDEVQSLKVSLYRIQKDLLGAIEKDAEVFAPLVGAFRMAENTEEEKAEKERVMQACLKEASLAPVKAMEACAEALPLLEVLAEKGSVLAISDAGCAAVLLKSAMLSLWLNVRINTRLIKDEQFASETEKRGRELIGNCIPIADRIYEKVEDKLK